MKVFFLIGHLRSGGAARVLTTLANYWASKAWVVTIATFDNSKPFYTLSSEVRHIRLNQRKESNNVIEALMNNLERIKVVRAAIKVAQPDIVISFLGSQNIIAIISSSFQNLPVIVSERNNPSRYEMGIFWRVLRHLVYPFAQKVVVQTDGIKDYFPSYIRPLICVIPNPVVSLEDVEMNCSVDIKKPSIIAAGRLHEQKGFDILIHAFLKICEKHPSWSLTIIGEGSMRSELEYLVDSLELSNRVFMPGVVGNPHGAFKKADLFVLSSRYEGFPNVLCEAMACGLAVISTDCPTGPSDIITDSVDGILVKNDDVDVLGRAMDSLMSNEQERKRLGEHAVNVVEKFSLENIAGIWEKVIRETIASKMKFDRTR